MSDFERIWQDTVDQLAASGRRRVLRRIDAIDGAYVEAGGRRLLDFCSNDYLGLSQHPLLKQRAAEWTAQWGAGSAASRLVRGNLACFEAVEAKLAAAKGAPAALILASGFQANLAVLAALLDRSLHKSEPLVFTDRLNHASLHMGCQAAGVRQIRFRHNDLGHLEDLLRANQDKPGPRFVVTETVFSMDGDRADVPALAALCERWGAFLYVDEAHATGVLGETGFGLATGLAGPNVLVMGTFSKALGGFGAYVACTQGLRDYLINRCSGFIYSTGLPPAALGAMDAAIDLVPQMAAERAALLEKAHRLRTAIESMGLGTGGSTTQIVPAIVGAEEDALRLARALEAEGMLAVAIRPPTVPAGTSRIRFVLSAHHDDAQLERLIEALSRLAVPA